MEVDVKALKRDWAGIEFDVVEVEGKTQDFLDFAEACGETESRFVDPEDADFQAPSTFTSRFVGRRMFPDRFPKIGDGFGFDAGKCVFAHAPFRPGDVLTASSKIHDIYEKTGRSGPMVFIVHRMEFVNQTGVLVSVVDWRMVQQPERKR
ncbi:MAG: MaoC family dehydratase [bacterium]|nr:MaoC family dehydratase [bacterium]